MKLKSAVCSRKLLLLVAIQTETTRQFNDLLENLMVWNPVRTVVVTWL